MAGELTGAQKAWATRRERYGKSGRSAGGVVAEAAGGSGFFPSADAVPNVAHSAEGQLEIAARLLASAIPNNAPVRTGLMQDLYRQRITVTVQSDGDSGLPRVIVSPGNPFWHWLEYGTQWNPPYRVIQRAAESLGLRYTPA